MIENITLYAPIIDETVKMVNCKYESAGQEYTFKCDFDVSVGDVVAVETSGWYKIVTVSRIDVAIPSAPTIKYAWIVSRLNLDDHLDRLQAEQKLIDAITAKRVDYQRKQMLSELGLTVADVQPMLAHDDIDHVDDENVDRKPIR